MQQLSLLCITAMYSILPTVRLHHANTILVCTYGSHRQAHTNAKTEPTVIVLLKATEIL